MRPSLKYQTDICVVTGKVSRRLKKKIWAINASAPNRKRTNSAVPSISIKGITEKRDRLPIELAAVAVSMNIAAAAHVRLRSRR